MAVVNLGMGRIEAMLKILDVEGAVRAGRHALAARARRDWTLRRRALRAGHRAAPRRAAGDGRVRRRRPLPDARPAGGARRPDAARTAGAARSAPGRASPRRPTRRSSSWPDATCARPPIELEVKKMAPDAGRRDAQDPRGRARRARLGAGAVRRRRLVAGDRARPARRASSRTRSSAALADLVRGARRRRRLGDDRAVGAARRRARAARRARRRRARRAARRAGRAPRAAPPQREMANAVQQAANVRGAFTGRRRRRRRASACCSTTGACRAGRWRWSAASCGAPAPTRVVPVALATLN